MENKKYLKELKEAAKDITGEATYIGEEGAMAVITKTRMGAYRKFLKRLREDMGDADFEMFYPEISIEQVGIGWLHLTTEEDKKLMDDCDWYVSYTKESPIEVWVLNES